MLGKNVNAAAVKSRTDRAVSSNLLTRILHKSFHLQIKHSAGWYLFYFPPSNQRQTEDKQRGVCEPRDPVAAAVPEERHQQVSLFKRANVGESLLKAPSVPNWLPTSAL